MVSHRRIGKSYKIVRWVALFLLIPGFLTSIVFAAGGNTNQDVYGFSEAVNGSPISGYPYMIGAANPAPENTNYVGGLFAEGRIWLIPHQGTRVVSINPNNPSDTNKYDYTTGYVSPQPKAFYGAAYDKGQRCLWFYPYNADRIVRFDMQTHAFTSYDFGYSQLSCLIESTVVAFEGGTFDGRNLWCAPISTNRIVKFDTVNKTYTHIPFASVNSDAGPVTFNNSYLYTGAIYDGTYVWMIPASNNYIIRVDPGTNELYAYKIFTTAYAGSTNGYIRDAVFDGTNIWLIANESNALYAFNTNAHTLATYAYPSPGTAENMGNVLGASQKFDGGAYDGANIWLFPRSADRIVRFTIATAKFQGFAMTNTIDIGYNLGSTSTTGGTKFMGGIFDGTNLWIPPVSAPRVLKITPTGGLSGEVRDSLNSRVIPNATVTLTHSSGAVFTTTTDVNGVYTKTNIPVGSYTVSGARADYDTATANGINVSAGTTAVFSFQLSPHLPNITGTAGAYTQGTWTNQNVTYQLTATPGAGATLKPDSYQFLVNTVGQWGDESTVRSMDFSAEGLFTVRGRASDTMGHTAETSDFSIRIDKTLPRVNIEEDSMHPPATVLEYSDEASGLKSALISVEDGAQGAAAPASGNGITAPGNYTLVLEDNAGNRLTRHFTITDGTVPLIEYRGCVRQDAINFTVYCHIYKENGSPIKWSSVNLYQTAPGEPGSKWIDQSWLVTSMDEQVSFSGVPAGTYHVIAKDTFGRQSILQIQVGTDSLILLDVSVPVKLMFASFATEDGAVNSPEYSFTNNSSADVKVSLSAIETVSADGIALTTGQEPGKLRLELIGGRAFARDLGSVQADTPMDRVLGILGRKDAENCTGQLHFGGRYHGVFSATAKRPSYTALFEFELVLPSKSQTP